MAIVTGQPRGVGHGQYFKYKRLNRRTPFNAGRPNYVRALKWATVTDHNGTQRHVRSQNDYICQAGDFPSLGVLPAGGQTYAQRVLQRPTIRNCIMRNLPNPHACDNNCTPSAFYADPNKDIHNAIDLCETPNMGIGVFATARLDAGTVVGLYTGRLRDKANLSAAEIVYGMDIGRLDRGPVEVVVDAWAQGGWSRFINHSCTPNLKMQSGLNCGSSKVMYFRTMRTIASGEQLFVDYGRDYFRTPGPRSRIIGAGCLCGAARCHSRKRSAPKRAAGRRR